MKFEQVLGLKYLKSLSIIWIVPKSVEYYGPHRQSKLSSSIEHCSLINILNLQKDSYMA
jgi:hypothetical protein